VGGRAAASRTSLTLLASIALLAFASPGRQQAAAPAHPTVEFFWRLPAGFPEPAVPADNPMSGAKVELGRHLFYDVRLSGSGHFSCASCHRQELAFTDGRGRAIGSTGETHPRSAMSLTNVAYNATYNWANPTMTRLEQQALDPMLNRDPIELGIAGRQEEVLERLRRDDEMANQFERAFPEEEISIDTVVRAIAAFERTLISGNSPYDRYVFWGEPLGETEKRGLELFLSERTRCSECHAGLNFSGPVRVLGQATAATTSAPRIGAAAPEFHNTGLFNEDGAGAYPAPNRGVFEITGRAEDMGRFRAPTLRNVEVTAPYMHDGSLATLDEVIRFYADGGRDSGRHSPLKSELLSGFSLTAQEQADLVAFLGALTDREFLTDRRFAAPREP
jgi:cytochrome c peroxidase